MGVTAGEDWGHPEEVPADAVWVRDDASARTMVVAARRAGQPLPRLCLTGGDLARGLGGGGGPDHLRRNGAAHFRVDIAAALIDGRIDWFISHLVARRSWLHGRILVVSNTDFLGRWNIAPRAHPGDGLLDLLDADLSIGDRLKARQRLPSGTHLPHPSIRVRRAAAFQVDFDRPTPVRLDGTRVGHTKRMSIRTEPDCLNVWI